MNHNQETNASAQGAHVDLQNPIAHSWLANMRTHTLQLRETDIKGSN
jgi:hypothetical protein